MSRQRNLAPGIFVSCLLAFLSPGWNDIVLAQVLISATDTHLNDAVKHNNRTLLATNRGLFSYINGRSTVKKWVPDDEDDIRDRALLCFLEVDDIIWAGAEGGVFEIEDGFYRRLHLGDPIDSSDVGFLEIFSSKVWLGTDQGLFSSEIGGGVSATNVTGEVSLLQVIGDTLWVSTAWEKRHDGTQWGYFPGNTYRLSSQASEFQPLDASNPIRAVNEIIHHDQYIYLKAEAARGAEGAGFRLYRYPDYLKDPLSKRVDDIALVDGVLWYSRGRQVYSHGPSDSTSQKRWELKSEKEKDFGIWNIAQTDDLIWLISSDEVFIQRRNEGTESDFKMIARSPGAFGGVIHEIQASRQEKEIWLLGSGSFRFYEDIYLDGELGVMDVWGLFMTMRNRITIGEISYKRGNDVWMPANGDDIDFRTIIEFPKDHFEKKKQENAYSSVEDHSSSSIFSSVYVSIRDARHGNIRDLPVKRGIFWNRVPGMWGFFLAFLLFLFLPLAIMLIPFPVARIFCIIIMDRYPILSRIMTPAPGWELPNVLLHKACSRGRKPGEGPWRDRYDAVLERLLESGNKRLTELTAKDIEDGVNLDLLDREVPCSQIDKMGRLFTLKLKLVHRDKDGMDGDKLYEKILGTLEVDFSDAKDDFRRKLFNHASFMLLISHKKGDDQLRHAIDVFMNSPRCKNHWIVLCESGLLGKRVKS